MMKSIRLLLDPAREAFRRTKSEEEFTGIRLDLKNKAVYFLYRTPEGKNTEEVWPKGFKMWEKI